MGPDPKLWLKTILKGLGQIAFCDRAGQGALVLAGIAFLSQTAAVLALCGAALGTLVGRRLGLRPENEWREGLAGVNPAIAGLFAAWLFPGDAVGVLSSIALVAATIAIDTAARPVFRRLDLPELSAPALAAVLGAWALHAALDMPFWPPAAPQQSGWFVVPSAALIFIALWLRSPRGAATTAALAGTAMLISGYAFGMGPVGPFALWVFTVAPIAFATHAVFMAGAWRGFAVGAAAAALGSGLWLLWVHSPLVVLPPLTAPMLIALWSAVLVCRAMWGKAIQIPELWYVAERIRRTRSEGKPVVALTGAGISTGSGIPDYVSGAWLDPAVPIGTYAFSRYRASSRCRRAYWDSCRRFRDLTLTAQPNEGHAALTELRRRGDVTAIITQNVDNLHQASGAADVIELHGTLGHVRCIDCGRHHEWPPGRVWHSVELRCTACGGLLKPAVTALGEAISPMAWRAACQAVKGCGVLLIIGSQLAVSSAAALVESARAEGALIVFINIGPAYTAGFRADIAISDDVQAVLPALAVLLDRSANAAPSGARTIASDVMPSEPSPA